MTGIPDPQKTTNTMKKILPTPPPQSTEGLELPAQSCSASSWQPIGTAPNGLAAILITDGTDMWIDQKIGCQVDDEPGDYEFNGHEEWEEVTHWMPLPSLPNA